MEDEIASICAIIGASLIGHKVMTATSGPGFSLMQEGLGYAVMAEIPCVIVNVQRGGPSTGLPTGPSQGDVYQARWGVHGDHEIRFASWRSLLSLKRGVHMLIPLFPGNYQYRYFRKFYHPFGHASQKDMPDPPLAELAHDDQLRVP